ncbi:site-specific DNA-methyltransferase [Fimbriiglobus ruber]|uniref:site-specific DNA-methyltransferase n=1 Tax=Fimbriiglobus ruber TaxID=1908690 RepID=UPI001930FEED|nr:site-specific DNA-methyltransferase [Fimbriiglobus ruber]
MAPIGRATCGAKNGDIQNGNAYQPPVKANPGIIINRTYTAEEVTKILARYEHGDIVDCVVGGGKMGHDAAHDNEAPYPLELVERFVLSCCPPGGTVADCFTGSGTTAHAAIIHGRNFIGCDIRESQVEIARNRLRDVESGWNSYKRVTGAKVEAIATPAAPSLFDEVPTDAQD